MNGLLQKVTCHTHTVGRQRDSSHQPDAFRSPKPLVRGIARRGNTASNPKNKKSPGNYSGAVQFSSARDRSGEG